MALAVRVSYGNSGSGTSITVTKDAAVTDGDYLIAFVTNQVTDRTITPPAGWTARANVANGINRKLNVYTKRASSEPATEAWTLTGGSLNGQWNIEITCLSGGTTDNFFESASAKNDNGSGVTSVTNSITASDSSAFFLAHWSQATSGAITGTITSPYTATYGAGIGGGGVSIKGATHAGGATTEGATNTWSSDPGGNSKLNAIIAVKAPSAAAASATIATTFNLTATGAVVNVPNRLTQEAVEALEQSSADPARLTQEAVEALQKADTSADFAHLTQEAIETLQQSDTSVDFAHMTQEAVEVLMQIPKNRFTVQII